MDKTNPIIERLGLTPEQLIGYPYAGLLAALLCAIVNPDFVKHIVDTLGTLLSTLVVLGTGVGIYAIYFKIIGEWFLYPLHHAIHRSTDNICKTINENYTSTTAYLGYLGVRIGKRRMAYEAIKSSFFNPPELRRRIQLSHGEVHVLYLTAIETFACALYIYFFNTPLPIKYFLILSGISLLGAIGFDIRQHSLETHLMKTKESELKEFLQKGCYL